MTFDLWLISCLQNLDYPWLDNLMIIITTLGNWGFIWLVSGLVLLFSKRYRVFGLLLLITLGLSTLVGQELIKPLIARPRPFMVDPTINILIKPPGDYSMPSGHSMSSFAVAFILWQTKRYWGIFAYIMAALIAFSRLWVGVHYPSDVLMGAIIGTALAWLIWYLAKKLCPNYFVKEESS